MWQSKGNLNPPEQKAPSTQTKMGRMLQSLGIKNEAALTDLVVAAVKNTQKKLEPEREKPMRGVFTSDVLQRSEV